MRLEASNTTNKLEFIKERPTVPAFRVMDIDGVPIDPNFEPEITKEKALDIYKNMIVSNTIDQYLHEAQNQGRISIYSTGYGEEAIIMTAMALEKGDMVYSQYRELSVYVQLGYPIEDIMNQCFSNKVGHGKGRQMPVHYGSKEMGLVTISSTLATQIPQAVGTAFALKREGNNNVVICYFGEGTSSEGDFHAGLNMASTIECPVIFYCRNNGYAISTPSSEQYRGDGIVGRGEGYGIKSMRIDGNDVWAVYAATKEAREYASKHNKPVLIEAMTYRIGNHTTSDDSKAYRSKEEVEMMRKHDPILRLRKYMKNKNWLDSEMDRKYVEDTKEMVLKTLKKAEEELKPKIEYLYTDVYDEMPPNLKSQFESTQRLVEKYPDYYKVKDFET
ncbi:hypothetical protein BB559_002358 [Furculomyces boomerangus]|uniref:2-oxoisovalerate dehydrogenase subunit alpha n=3 Tax=Harpellales TaxID=61421 RepID=A0A2T9YW25_9FUNG|nr:hypothetical protein BB559_002358 [Furculomyces boomerangus]PWA00460.1 hypothetical protein BB558_003469 [Smittium angustum]